MREQLTRVLPDVRVLIGTAEEMPLERDSVDAVLVAQAFHWFDAPAAAAEIHRVLRPRGGLGVIWNSWDESVPWVARVQALVHEHAGQARQQRSSAWVQELERSGLFGSLARAEFPNLVPGGVDMLRARVASVSYISALDETTRSRLLDAVAAVVAADPATRGREELEMPYTTSIVWTRALSRRSARPRGTARGGV